MQTTLLALAIWCYSYCPNRPVPQGRHASRRVSSRTRFCAALLVTVALLRGRADCRSARPGRHRSGHDPAFWHRQRTKFRASRSRTGAHG